MINDLGAYEEMEDHLDQLQNIIRDFNSPHLIHEVFRLVHSIKGVAQMIEAQNLSSSCHLFEDYLIQIKEGVYLFDQKFIKNFYHFIDFTYKEIESQKNLAAA